MSLRVIYVAKLRLAQVLCFLPPGSSEALLKGHCDWQTRSKEAVQLNGIALLHSKNYSAALNPA